MRLSPEEQAVLDDIRRTGGFRTDEDAIKGALFWYARFLDLEVHHDVFGLARPVEPPDPRQADLFAGEDP